MKRLLLVLVVAAASLFAATSVADAHPRRVCYARPAYGYAYYAPARVRYVYRPPVRITYGYAAPAYVWGYGYPVAPGYYYYHW